MSHLVRGVAAVLLQREVPDHVNLAVAQAAAAAGVPVIQVSGSPRIPHLHRFCYRFLDRVISHGLGAGTGCVGITLHWTSNSLTHSMYQ